MSTSEPRADLSPTESSPVRVHLVAGGFPRGSSAGHDIDFVRLQILELLQRSGRATVSVSSDFQDLESWLPVSRFLVTYTAGPYLDEEASRSVAEWIEGGGRWLALHGTSGGRAVPNADGRPGRTMSRLDHHDLLGRVLFESSADPKVSSRRSGRRSSAHARIAGFI